MILIEYDKYTIIYNKIFMLMDILFSNWGIRIIKYESFDS